MDVELPQAKAYGPTLVEAVRNGSVSEELLDRSVLRVLQDKYALGLFDEPYVPEDEARITEIAKNGADLARQLARESNVLLKNDHETLPLAKRAAKSRSSAPTPRLLTSPFWYTPISQRSR